MRLPPAPWLCALLCMLAASMVAPFATTARAGTLHAAQRTPFATQQVEITATGAQPQVITVTVGDAIQFSNVDTVAHTITSDTNDFGPLQLGVGDSATVPFTIAASYPYHIDATQPLSFTGTIIVIGGMATDTPTPSDTATPTKLPNVNRYSDQLPNADG